MRHLTARQRTEQLSATSIFVVLFLLIMNRFLRFFIYMYFFKMPHNIQIIFINAFIVFQERILEPKISKQHTTNELTDNYLCMPSLIRYFLMEIWRKRVDKVIFVQSYIYKKNIYIVHVFNFCSLSFLYRILTERSYLFSFFSFY